MTISLSAMGRSLLNVNKLSSQRSVASIAANLPNNILSICHILAIIMHNIFTLL